MKQIVVIGHFADGKDKINGQTIKTIITYEELVRRFGTCQVSQLDTGKGWRLLLALPMVLIKALRVHRNVIVMPAYRAIFIITPLLALLNLFFRRRLLFITIGGRLSQAVRKAPWMRCILSNFYRIYAETQLACDELKDMRVSSVTVMPNTKPLHILSPAQLPTAMDEPLPLCTFSRVSADKGIPDAVEAVKRCNQQLGRTAFSLDIYGQVDNEEWFAAFMKDEPDYIRYQGTVSYVDAPAVLSKYFLLLFPTFYPGECFAGTLIDALASGLPVIASDWRSNGEIVIEHETGFLFTVHQVDKLVDILLSSVSSRETVLAMRPKCLAKAYDYLPQHVMEKLVQDLDLEDNI